MKSTLALLVAALAVNAAPQRRTFQDSSPQQQVLQDLSTEDFQHVQDALKDSLEQFANRRPGPAVEVTKESFSIPNPFPGHHSDSTLDFSHLTILEIVNASLGHHHHGHHEEGKIAPTVIDEKDPAHLPLHRLAWLVNFSSETQEYLRGDDITLLAPDDQALTPPHRRGGQGDHDHPHHFVNGPHDSLDLDKSHVPHPFHSKEFSPEHLHELASSSEGDDDDKEKERKREIFRKIISYVGKYHVIPGRRQPHDLAEVSTVATLLEDSRLRVSPGFDWRPLPHPTLKFNYYVSKRGPTIIAKNGIIHLVSGPLAPPFGPLNELFLFPKFFSSLTSDIQKVGLDEDLLPHHDASLEDDDQEEVSTISEQLVEELVKENGVKEYTLFAPSNFAYARVPTGLQVALHFPFPFAKKVLKYIIAGHVVPDIVFFSDFLKNDTSSSTISKFQVSHEEDVSVPFEWLEEDARIARVLPIAEEIEKREWKMPTFPRRGRPATPPPPPSPPHKGPRGRPPFPLPPREDHPREHPHANVTHYELPTLLTAQNPNATLKVAVVAYRLGPGDKGPIKRSVVVFPHRPEHHRPHEDKFDASMCPRQDPFSPIKAVFADFPARAGAIHVLPRLIPPPPPPHHDEDGDKSESLFGMSNRDAKKLRKALARLF
ncbi:uncharacterized protein JCM6883_001841 [Sporobolomyces salmoneus]|uniref:uncharacterized protein n=1 Tax=Sporobolomyces salmoneus TaxID=183962 RepID=UPI00317FC9B4